MDNAGSAFISLQKSPEESIMVTVTENSAQNSGRTRISIVHTTNKKPS
jgi:hypothetical protein